MGPSFVREVEWNDLLSMDYVMPAVVLELEDRGPPLLTRLRLMLQEKLKGRTIRILRIEIQREGCYRQQGGI
eukprot:CAMPEP_0175074296 /NCGR_PEP_ID=MMETSP0052_2-20121109/21205_1 /TAXON_ID=51329 ORGANISM="Polytomella parva, Strain SAG 63-3" /NCGR_SAMPLE_ID=MMETSP0052_2 /ASSEMBLY_ACC=CAM_ASM_000194 /LENGTH=71 /DNA_ID=CAMNT_0016342533 /DNA_START=133 /DNA_END=348 /DNA_ORIENTATION=-